MRDTSKKDPTMPASEAQIRANQQNALKSSGPKTEDGKARSRGNALKHGLTGEGIVLPEQDAAEVERLAKSFAEELQAEGEVGQTLARRMAVMSVRMKRCVERETAAASERVRRAIDEFEAPEGVDAAEAERLQAEAARLALFDLSKESVMARKYEASAERCFFRSLKELRQRARESTRSAAQADTAVVAAKVAAQAKASLQELGSFLPARSKPEPAPLKPPATPSRPALIDWDPFAPKHTEVPIAIGRPL